LEKEAKRKLLGELDSTSSDVDALNFKVGELEKNIRDLDYDKGKLTKQNESL